MKLSYCFSVLAFLSLTTQGAVRQAEVIPGEFIVKLKPGVLSAKNKNQLANSLNAQIKNEFPSLNLISIKQLNELKSTDSIYQSGLVEYVEPNYVYRMNKLPNDTSFKSLWGLKNTAQKDSAGAKGVVGFDINAEKAWDITTGSKNLIVAVIDTGIDYEHPDLKANIWTNMKELNGKKGVDDDGNGVIDDIHGYNAITEDGNALDDQGHGSHCAGTIGGAGNNALGVAGVNWNTSLMAVKFLGADGSGSTETAIKAIQYATKMGAKVMSNSWGGGGFSQALLDAISESNKAGALFVAAAGNSASNNDKLENYPSNYDLPNILAVSAIDNRGKLANFSSYGLKKVHIGAPGVNILSTTGGAYDSFSGTSMATPHVAGVAALVWGNDPKLTALELKARLIATAKPIASLKGKVSSGGMVDAFAALKAKK